MYTLLPFHLQYITVHCHFNFYFLITSTGNFFFIFLNCLFLSFTSSFIFIRFFTNGVSMVFTCKYQNRSWNWMRNVTQSLLLFFRYKLPLGKLSQSKLRDTEDRRSKETQTSRNFDVFFKKCLIHFYWL